MKCPLNPLFIIGLTIDSAIFAETCNVSILDCPGLGGAPAVITIISTSPHSSYVAALTLVFLFKYSIQWFKSIASPKALSLFKSIIKISSHTPCVIKLNAVLDPTNPVPTIATFLLFNAIFLPSVYLLLNLYYTIN